MGMLTRVVPVLGALPSHGSLGVLSRPLFKAPARQV